MGPRHLFQTIKKMDVTNTVVQASTYSTVLYFYSTEAEQTSIVDIILFSSWQQFIAKQ